MRKAEALLLILFLAIEMWAGISAPGVSAASVRSATINLIVGETYEFNYFNLTLVDLNPVTRTALINVSGIQGTNLTTVEDAFVDIFGDGTIQIKTIAVYVSNKQAMVEVRVDVEILANVACDMLSSLITEVEFNGTLPDSVLNQSKQDLELAEQYRDYGWYDDAIKTAWRALDNLRKDIRLATEARKAIMDAKRAVFDPSTCVPGCQECPLSIVTKAKNMINEAEQYYNQGDFEDALQMANEAIQLITDCCNSCKVYPEKKEKLEDYLEKWEQTIPSTLFKSVRDKIKTAQDYYDNGDCVDAISYLDDAQELAETIVRKWNETTSCRDSLLSNIARARKNYKVIFNGTVIRIYVDDINETASNDLYNLIKSGYFESALSKCNKLSDELSAREEQFNEIKVLLGEVWGHIMSVKAKGYVVEQAVNVFREALSLMEQGKYEEAKGKFQEAKDKVDSIVTKAKEAERAKNQTLSCLTNLKAEGIDVQSVFGEDISTAEELYKKGDYDGARLQWESIQKKCSDPELKNLLELKDKAHTLYAEVEAKAIRIPPDVTSLLEKADEDFRGGDFPLAKVEYNQVMGKLNDILDTVNRAKEIIKRGRQFCAQNSKWGKNVVRWFGIPVIEQRFEKLKVLLNQAQAALDKGDYTALNAYTSEINALMGDIDGDGSENRKDPLPYVPNYYLVGLLFAALMMFLNAVR